MRERKPAPYEYMPGRVRGARVKDDVYITRAAHHFDGAQVPIAEGDWRAIVENDPDLRAPDEAYPSYAVWSGTAPGGSHWIDWANGNLFTRTPNDLVLGKLLELAELLGARVQGYRGESYRLDEQGAVVVGTPSDPEVVSPGAAASPPLDHGSPPADVAEPAPALLSDRPPGLRLRDASQTLEHQPDGLEPHAGASFAPSPEDLMTVDRGSAGTADLPFTVGQRVRTEWGQPATIVSIDRHADGGLGKIELRYRDGRVAYTNCSSHGLEALAD